MCYGLPVWCSFQYAIGYFAGSNGNGGGGRRKGKSRRQQTFVGPMDHSYRVVNGNMAEASHNAPEYRGNGNGHHVELAPKEAVAAPVR